MPAKSCHLTQIKAVARTHAHLGRMELALETLGNATLLFREDGRHVLATDPWLEGSCYRGSWALDRPLTDDERASVLAAEYIWISHGHPDHFHPASLKHFPGGQKVLLPDFYVPDMRNYLTARGFEVTVLPYRQWVQLSPGIRCLCLDNENQDAILVIEAGDDLIVNLNDSPLCGDERFIRTLVKKYDRRRTYAAALYSNDADMMNFVDPHGRRLLDRPEKRKPGMVWTTARTVDRLGVGNYIGSASQHIYARADSVWANPYRVTWHDVERNWTRPHIRTIEPFVVIDLKSGEYRRKHPTQTSDLSQITSTMLDDDWNERMNEADWALLAAYFARIEILQSHLDTLDFVVGGERRRAWESKSARGRRPEDLRGIVFHAPRQSLVKTLKHGYFDDILIGNFMSAELHSVGLYPHFTPIVSKLAGSSKVYTFADLRRFKRRYFRRNPLGYLEWRIEEQMDRLTDAARRWAAALGVKRPLRRIYRWMIGDPVTSD